MKLIGAIDMGERTKSAIAVVLALASTLLSTALVFHLPVAILSGAGYDDAWFWQRAEMIGNGEWLGTYNQYTLMKGAGYPLFLLLTHALGLSISMAQPLLHGLAVLILGSAVYRMSGRMWWSLLLVLVMQWHPAALTWERAVRDNIGAAQGLLVLGCVLHFLISVRAGRRGYGWAATAGLVLGWFLCTREDGIWLLPGLAVLVLAGLVKCTGYSGCHRRFAAGVAMMATAGFMWLGTIAAVNKARYGEFVVVDVKSGGFQSAMAALQRVRVGDAVPYVPVPEKVRQAVYKVSPAFARLRPVLEGTGKGWTQSGCRFYPDTCSDYAGGWFLWVLRDAATAAGAYGSASTSDVFYRQIAADVEKACGDGRLTCVSGGIGLLPSMDQYQWKSLPESFWHAAKLLLWQDVKKVGTGSHVEHPWIEAMWRYLGRPYVPESKGEMGPRAIGWFRSQADAGAWIAGACEPGGARIQIARDPSPDVAAHFNDPAAAQNRFSAAFPRIQGCFIEAVPGGARLALSDIAPDQHNFALAGGAMTIDALLPGIDVSRAMSTRAVRIRDSIERFYAALLPVIAIAGVLAFLWASVRVLQSRRFDMLYATAAAGWCLLACRVFILLLVDVSSFPAIKLQYMQPAFPLLVLAAVCSLMCLAGRIDTVARHPAHGSLP